jgi:WD40 repeat protein
MLNRTRPTRPYLSTLIALAALLSLAAVAPALAQEQAPLPKFAKARIGTDRWGATIRATSFGPDDAVAAAYDNGYVRRWDLSTQHLLWEARPTTRALTATTFAGTSALIVIAEDGSTTLLNAADGAITKTFQLDICNKACELQEIQASDKVLLTLGVVRDPSTSSNQGTLRLWSLSDGKLLQTHVVANVSSAALSPDGAHVAWTAFEQPAPAYLASAAAMSSAKPLTCPVRIDAWEPDGRALLFTPNSQTLAVLGLNTTNDALTTCLWSADKAAPLHTIDIPANTSDGYMNRLRAVISSTDSKWLQVAYDEGNYGRDDFYVNTSPVTALNLTTGAVTSLYDLPSPISWTHNHSNATLTMSDTGLPVRAQGQGSELSISTSGGRWGTTTHIPPKWLVSNAHTSPITQLVASPLGDEVISVDRVQHTLRWRVGGGAAPIYSLQTQGQLLYTPDGLSVLEAHPAILRGSNEECSTDPRIGSLGLWNLSSMTRTPLRRGPKLMINAARWLPDGRLLTCREQHDANTSECGYPQGPVHSYFEAISPNGQAVEPFKASLSMCPTDAGISPATARAITFYSEDLESGAGGYSGGTARVQDLTTGDLLLTLPEGVPTSAALSPDGKWVAFASDDNDKQPLALHVFSVDAKAKSFSIPIAQKTLWQHGAPFTVFSPDNRVIFNDGQTLRVADPTLGADAPAKALTITGHTASVSAATFSADGKTLFTAQYDGLIYAWDWPALTAP